MEDRVALGSQVAQLADDAKKAGCGDLANRLEDCLIGFLSGLSKTEKRAVLLMAYDAAIRQGEKEADSSATVLALPAAT